jgi:drug/metabolite transporter (DMT)-like permease
VTGALWAAASGIGFGLFQALNRRAIRDIEDPHVSTFIQVVIAAAVLVVATVATGEAAAIWDATAWGLGLFALAGLMHFLGGWTFLNISQKRIGAARSSPLFNTTPLFGLALAAIVLQQIPGLLALAAMLPMVFGSFLVATPDEGLEMRWVDALPGLGTALMWASSPMLALEGLKGLHSPVAGLTVGILTAVAAYAAMLAWRGTGLGLAAMDRGALAYKAVGAVLVGLSSWWRWVAVAETSVAVVLALNLLSVPVVLFLAPLLVGRQLEHVTPRVWVGSALVVAGAMGLIFAG